jgi:hypothetical protein
MLKVSTELDDKPRVKQYYARAHALKEARDRAKAQELSTLAEEEDDRDE